MEEIYIDGIHEYDYLKTATKDETVHTLYYSDHIEWSGGIVGTKAIELIDSGNGVSINNTSLNDEDYLRIEQLHVLLRLYSQPSVYEISQPSIKTKF